MAFESLLYSLLLTLIVALITYNIVTTTSAVHQTPTHEDDLDSIIRKPSEERLFHTAVTATDSAYNKWQCRVMYYWHKKQSKRPGSDMGGFTRVLHSGRPDNLMDEIPTYVVDPLAQGKDHGYVVLNRPWAFVQWLSQADIKEKYILMAEPDHIIVKPIPNLAKGSLPAAFPFFYITPAKYENVIRKFFPEDKGPITKIDPIGNSPVIIKKESLEKIAPTWLNVSLAMKMDSEADQAFGWVLEMYGYAVASALHGVQHALRTDFMIQPPWDLEVAEKFIIHYTYGCDYDMKGKLTYGKIGEWRFDKRSFDRGAPPRNLPLPPPGVPESVVTLVKMVNEATSNIPNWKEGE
ncbi:hypothetical protein SUGI_0120820 [Cryptomeria japonica]|uniref:hydroxyproline O-arabinosyltransferase 1 n=1 Tax=Cryptomeria japonica TaxID=3369 RepID=UPI002408DB9E|nr:hydroxyproline O-arabinosyltransferase 1 [Cryptomeria japonica]GLJ10046.1 hypothetical protein SUGI_0120820 [Cryptomeria japonica]